MRTTLERGKITVLTLLGLVGVFVLASLFDVQYRGHVAGVEATSTATTTVTVLNTPPGWTETAREQIASATSSPTNEGTSTIIRAIATDNNSENYMLVICKASTTVHVVGTAAPYCGAGAVDTWGYSATTTSGSAAIVTISTAGLALEEYHWYGYICDRNPSDPKCNGVMYNGLQEAGPASATSSPFVVNHAPTISNATVDSGVGVGANPGSLVTWTTTATDTDTIRGGDALTLYVCQLDNFDATIPGCLTQGKATSTASLTGTQATSSLVTIPTQDGIYSAYVFVVDPFKMEAVGADQGSSQAYQVNNVAPVIGGAATFGLYDVNGSTTADILLSLTVPEGLTTGFIATFDVTDNNGCLATSSTNEIQSIEFNVARSGSSTNNGTGCDGDDQFNANSCYEDTYNGWTPNCYQVPGATCTGSTPYVRWECTFPLWFIADPTDVGSKYPTEHWMAVARAVDDGFLGAGPLTSANGTSTTITEMTQFLSFNATGSPIAYGSFEPGFGNTVHPATTTVYATGNTGLDEYLSSDPMCLTYPTCSGSPTNTIPTGYQHWSLTNTTAFWSGATSTGSTTPSYVNSAINKATATTTPSNCTLGGASCGNTYWGIFVPSAITFAGDYVGRNYIDAVISNQADW